ncbi:hypothetical protein BFP72_05360 [Reichenbachiella sp. 5M10]|uniref:HAD family hydrolase n=1 Tax=Reichenbachiella sp. 5M10 TaxID=1889772 RepID=UPI000C5C0376|nr:HAD family phosphatase [Reichenbachiella sp. 5M10]PIB34871.1 hypothetical protein BFP72_05360 [Reichenbachiella sp. 5M10]
MNINTIIFDLGGVIIDLNEKATVEAFAQLSGKDITEVVKYYQESDTFKQYEMGLIPSDEFRAYIREILDTPQATDHEIDRAWNAMLGNIPLRRLEWMIKLQKTYKICILSNTNAIHESAFNQTLLEVSGKPCLDDFAHEVYFSHRLHLRKPNMDIYEKVLELSGQSAAGCLFLDDKLENLKGAASVGIQTMHISYPDEIFKLESRV